MLAVSTSWDHKADLDVEGWIKKIKSLGISALELGYSLNKKQLDEFIHLLPRNDMKVLSIHNFCPTPYDEPSSRHVSNHYRLSSTDPHERERAVFWTKNTIDTACQVKAQVVVIHAGTIDVADQAPKTLIALYKDGKSKTKEFEAARQETIQVREQSRGPFLEALTKSLEEILPYAKQQGIKIGLETRYYPFEMPNFEEVGLFLNKFKGQNLFYWHDVGHAEVNERLGITPHLDFLKTYQKELIGVHLHGIRELRDHLAVFDGDMDLEPKLDYFGKGIIKVVESRYGHFEQLKEGILRLQRKFLNDHHA